MRRHAALPAEGLGVGPQAARQDGNPRGGRVRGEVATGVASGRHRAQLGSARSPGRCGLRLRGLRRVPRRSRGAKIALRRRRHRDRGRLAAWRHPAAAQAAPGSERPPADTMESGDWSNAIADVGDRRTTSRNKLEEGHVASGHTRTAVEPIRRDPHPLCARSCAWRRPERRLVASL